MTAASSSDARDTAADTDDTTPPTLGVGEAADEWPADPETLRSAVEAELIRRDQADFIDRVDGFVELFAAYRTALRHQWEADIPVVTAKAPDVPMVRRKANLSVEALAHEIETLVMCGKDITPVLTEALPHLSADREAQMEIERLRAENEQLREAVNREHGEVLDEVYTVDGMEIVMGQIHTLRADLAKANAEVTATHVAANEFRNHRESAMREISRLRDAQDRTLEAGDGLLGFLDTNGIFGDGNFNPPTETEALRLIDDLRAVIAEATKGTP